MTEKDQDWGHKLTENAGEDLPIQLPTKSIRTKNAGLISCFIHEKKEERNKNRKKTPQIPHLEPSIYKKEAMGVGVHSGGRGR